MIEVVSRGEFAINGFRNRDIRALLYGEVAKAAGEKKRQSSTVTRKVRLLRAHGLVNKVSRTHRYVLSPKGRQSITAILAARSATAAKLLAAA